MSPAAGLHEEPLLPRYGRKSLAEVLPAALAALGVPTEPGAGGPSEVVLPPVRALALLLIDGLGADLLRRFAEDAPFLAGLPDAGPLTAGFPSSTSISLVSLGTGTPPGAHGVVGISFRTGDELLDSLRWTTHGTADNVDRREEHPPEEVQSLPTAFERATAAGVAVTVVSQRQFRGSGLTRAALRGGRFRGTFALGDLAAEVVTAVERPGRQLCYGYHSELDGLGHLYGPGSLPWRMQLAQVDRLAARIAEDLPSGALLAITGDHGMVEVDRRFDFDRHTDLRRGVLLLGGDPRARHVYTRAGAEADVLAIWREVLGDSAWVLPRAEAVARNWFGPVAERTTERIGDIVVATRGTAAVTRSEAEPVISGMPGQHGSLTPAEQLVPLLLSGPS
ncbi:alkaline phosphatase family protein [Pseudonocardia humida]|uniref:alkaline phosphatase family protein n=1 Tax=Pseudonocardia humida TaxID=2800819 RepID=UPI00207D629F|nr:nucleotide pyrophosphatase/phosphodiesterase family protein [Pseudonocardia humida]